MGECKENCVNLLDSFYLFKEVYTVFHTPPLRWGIRVSPG